MNQDQTTVTGKLIRVFPELKGTSTKTGKDWRKKEALIKTSGQYSKEIIFTCFGDKSIQAIDNFPINQEIRVYVNIESRESNSRYFTTLNAYKIEAVKAEAQSGPKVTSIDDLAQSEDDDLPF